MRSLIAVTLIASCLSGCLGYHIGPVKPYYLRDVHSIAVPTFTNRTLLPRVEVLVTDTVIKQLQQDGTFEVTSEDKADATLKGEITHVERAPARPVRGNILQTAEFALTIYLKYTLVNKSGAQLAVNEIYGSTTFFVGTDVITDERQALPLATGQLATNLVAQLSEGW
ncbi:MAG TPA: LptE family protein [Chthoniobacterales bacterium]|nr:LptE family protein [Chthoniobacterales bacterium]